MLNQCSFFRRNAAVFLLFTFVCPAVSAENWPQWRGPTADSVSTEKNLPFVWNKVRGVKWVRELPGWGASSPIVWGDAVFVTSQKEDDLYISRVHKKSGEIVWSKKVGSAVVERAPIKKKSDEERTAQKFHNIHNAATPSPVTDGKVVVVHFGNGDLAAYDFDGAQLWKRNLQDDYGPYTVWWGHGNSPIIFENFVINICLQDSLIGTAAEKPSESYVVAHDLRTGKERWRTLRMTEAKAEECDSYTTPVIRKRSGHEWEMVVWGGNQLDAYDPKNGKQRWYMPGLVGGRTVTSQTVFRDLVFVTIGLRGSSFAFKLQNPNKADEAAASGIVTEKSAEPKKFDRADYAWRFDKGTPDSCTPVVWDKLLFTVNDDGVARCFNAENGNMRWQERLPDGYRSSPLAADGRIYFFNLKGKCLVISASSRFEKLTENELDDSFVASPAVSDGMIYIRGKKGLYGISKD